MLNAISKLVLSTMIDKLQMWEGENREVYASDLAYELFEVENADGSMWCPRYAAVEFIKEHFDELYMAYEDMSYDIDDKELCNPLADPERFVVIFYIWLANQLVFESETLTKASKDNDFEEIVFTDNLIKTICKEWNEAIEEEQEDN